MAVPHEPSMTDISRRLDSHRRDINDRIHKDVYEAHRQDLKDDISMIRDDITGIKISLKEERASRAQWTRVMVATLVSSSLTLVGLLAFFLLERVAL